MYQDIERLRRSKANFVHPVHSDMVASFLLLLALVEINLLDTPISDSAAHLR